MGDKGGLQTLLGDQNGASLGSLLLYEWMIRERRRRGPEIFHGAQKMAVVTCNKLSDGDGDD